MKRKEYRNRLEVLLSVERDRWPDFVDLCDREHKSTSLKFSEMIEEELQKNALGVQLDPLNLRTYSNNIDTYVSNKPCQTDLTQWIDTVHQHKDDMIMLTKMAQLGTAITATANDYIRKNRRPYK